MTQDQAVALGYVALGLFFTWLLFYDYWWTAPQHKKHIKVKKRRR